MNWDRVSDTELIKAYVERFTIPAGDPIRSATAVADHFRGYFHDAKKKERFVCCFLNGQNQTLATETLFEGSLTSSAVYPREVVQRVLELGAAAVVFGHNHPSGSIKVSSHDRQVTRKLQTALDSIDVRVLDHIIIGGEDFTSFAESGIL